jgi:biotin operon repressor
MHANIHESDSPRNGRVVSKRDEYIKDRFAWIDQVIADPYLPASASKVAYVIATSLWRSKGTVTLVTPEITASDHVREAWIGTREIADRIGMSRFTVMKEVRRLEQHGHLEIDPGKQGRGHSNHYRLVRKGAPANLLKGKQTKSKGAHSSLLDGAPAKQKTKTKGAPANLLDGEKVSPRTSRGAPTHLNPSVPSESTPSEEGGASKARPGTDSGKSSTGGPELKCLGTTVDDGEDGSGGGLMPPPEGPPLPDHPIIVRLEDIPDGLILDQDGNQFKRPPPRQRRPPTRTWMDAAFEGYTGERS